MTPMFVLSCVRAQACHRKCQHNFGSLESAPDAYLGCVYGSLFPSLQPGWTGSPGWHDNLPLAAEPSQAPRLLDDSKHPFRNSFSLCSSSWLGTSYVDQTDLTQGATCLPLLVSAGIPVWSTNCSWSPPCSPRQGISFCRALRCCSSG